MKQNSRPNVEPASKSFEAGDHHDKTVFEPGSGRSDGRRDDPSGPRPDRPAHGAQHGAGHEERDLAAQRGAEELDDAGPGPQGLPGGDARRPREQVGHAHQDEVLHQREDAGQQLTPAGIDPNGSIAEARRRLGDLFRSKGIEAANYEARILIEELAGAKDLDVDLQAPLGHEAAARIEQALARRLAGEPLWRILGEREFWGLTFRLSPATLEPRPDTETLVDAALDAFAGRKAEPLRILDLGTGTGCLLIALSSEFRRAQGLGIDLSEDACATASANAGRNGVADRVTFRHGNWTEELHGFFDLIVSNPPYIRTDAIRGLSREVREHDPLLALDGGEDGLGPYRIFAATLAQFLSPSGLIVLEIGAGQETEVVELMQAGGFRHLGSRRDLGGHVRALSFGHAGEKMPEA